MLKTLYLTNFALIKKMEMDFFSGFNVLSGETGAGKSIIIGALRLLTGERAVKSVLRHGAKRCVITGVFKFKHKLCLNSVLDEKGIPYEEGELILRRTITENDSRNFVNNIPVPLYFLKELGELIIDVHGPDDNQILLKKSNQRELLDTFGNLAEETNECKVFFEKDSQLRQKLKVMQENIPSPDNIEILKHQLNEIKSSEISPEYYKETVQKHSVSANSQKILEISSRLTNMLRETQGSVADKLTETIKSLEELQRIDEKGASPFIERITVLSEEVNELTIDVERYAGNTHIDPPEFEKLCNRLENFVRIKRKYGGSVEEVMIFADSAKEKLYLAEHFSDKLDECQNKIDKNMVVFKKKAEELSSEREKIANKLAKKITAKLQFLGFNNCSFEVQLSKKELSQNGMDVVEFCFAPNAGQPLFPLTKIASSGEISRVMLAIKSILAKSDNTPVLIFDEIDSNIGGAIGGNVGKELFELGKKHQVFCITHLPQVAAGGKHHFGVSKKEKDGETFANIKLLDKKERLKELSRMLSGSEETKTAEKHAKELIKMAPK
ncbi:MAG: DNA repair protein RecN [Verrucomicrobiota bacterium]|nr:DNA repair protein RecN [Verrucomicrobiota bacterium]